MSKPKLRLVSSPDEETPPTPDEDTEIGKANRLAEKNKKPPHAVDVEQETLTHPPKQPSG